MSSPSSSADRNLLAGIFALQHEFVTRDQLIDAMSRWVTQKQTPLEQLLPLDDDDRALLEGMLRRHLAKHHDDVQRSLHALAVDGLMRSRMEQLADNDIAASVLQLPPRDEQEAWRQTVVPADGADWSGSRFRPRHEHARGGLGVVFLAEDAELHRDVALKEIHADKADHPVMRARFLLEGEITGRLEHPGVVPVYSMGKYADGRPYYAMRFIKGESLQDAIKRFHVQDADPGRDPAERSLALRGLLGRFVAVCNTMGHAHSKGVIHRDLKPANVMLGNYGETLVVDWGLAKAQDRPESAIEPTTRLIELSIDTEMTRQGQVLGTPAYMSPEQANGEGERMGVASDVFALGAVLYALLTGAPPYEGESALSQAQRGEVVPPRLHKRTAPAALEAVCLKAMAKEPQKRYAKATDLAAEVERWLADEAVTACRDPWREKARRWAKRNRGLVAAAAAVLLTGVATLGGGLYLVTQEQHETARQRDRAERALGKANDNLDRARTAEEEATANLKLAKANLGRARTAEAEAKRAVDELYTLVTEHELLQRQSMKDVQKLLLQKAQPYYKGFRSRLPDDLGLQFEVGQNLHKLASIDMKLGEHAPALATFEQCREIFIRLVNARPEEPEYLEYLGRTHNNLGILKRVMKKNDEALKEHLRACDLLNQLTRLRPDVPLYQQLLARVHNGLGQIQAALGRREEALLEYQRSRDLHAELAAAHPKDPQYLLDQGKSHNNIGVEQLALGNPAEALREFQRARDIFLKLNFARSENPDYRNLLGGTLYNIGDLQQKAGKLDVAAASLAEALPHLQAAYNRDPRVPNYRLFLLFAHRLRADVLSDLNRRRESIPDWDRALELSASDVERLEVRIHRATSLLARAGEYAAAAAVADEIGRDPKLPADYCFYLAPIHALNAASVGRDSARPLAVREKLTEEYACAAVALLRRAEAGGYFRDKTNLARMHKDADFAALRGRADYQEFVAGIGR